MHSFKDQLDREWLIELDVSTLVEIGEATGIEWANAASPQYLEGLDVVSLVNAIYLACRGQCEERGMTDEDFGRMLVDCFDEAAVAFVAEYCEFVPRGEVLAELYRAGGIAA